MKKELYKKLAELESEKDLLDAKIKETRKAIVDDMTENKVDKVESDFGTFKFRVNKSYIFSEALKLTEESVMKEIEEFQKPKLAAIDELKQNEIKDGVAAVKESKTLVFNSTK